MIAGTGGFALNGVAVADGFSGLSVSGAGDVDGDGLADLIVGASGVDVNGANSGQSYVVFGKFDGTTVELADVVAGIGGFAVNGVAVGDSSGLPVAGVGDVNGDGLADVTIGATGAAPNGENSGQSYVVFGKADGGTVDLAEIVGGVGGFAINGTAAGDFSAVVGNAGDVNGDGLADVIVGTTGASDQSYLVFGKADGATVELAEVTQGIGGFALNGIGDSFTGAGRAVSGAGDVDGDGFDDLVIGAPFAEPNGMASGQSYVVFGGNFTGAVDGLGDDGDDIR